MQITNYKLPVWSVAFQYCSALLGGMLHNDTTQLSQIMLSGHKTTKYLPFCLKSDLLLPIL